MTSQVREIITEMEKGPSKDLDRLAQLMSEFDAQGTGVSLVDLIKEFGSPHLERKTEEDGPTNLKRIMDEVAMHKISGGKPQMYQTFDERATNKVLARKAGIGSTTKGQTKEMDDLLTIQKSLVATAKLAKDGWEKFAQAGGETIGIAGDITAMRTAMQGAATKMENINAFFEGVNKQTADTKSVIDAVENLTAIAIAAINDLAAKLGDVRATQSDLADKTGNLGQPTQGGNSTTTTPTTNFPRRATPYGI
jgi:hypothetical protein